MRKIILVSLAALVAAIVLLAVGPSPQFKPDWSEESPDGDLVAQQFSNGVGEHEIWLYRKEMPDERVLLYKHHRYVKLCFSPDERWICITDHVGSTDSYTKLFRRGEGICFSEVTEARVGEKAWSFFAKENGLKEPPAYMHAYTCAAEWAANSRALLICLSGHGDTENHLESWYCVFDLDTLSPSLDLKLMNRGAFVSNGNLHPDGILNKTHSPSSRRQAQRSGK